MLTVSAAYPSHQLWWAEGIRLHGFTGTHVLLHLADDATSYRLADAQRLRDELERADTSVEIFAYPGTRHGFLADIRPDLFEAAAAELVLRYIERAITYLYFAPTVLGWQDTTTDQTTPTLLDEVSRWMTLDLARSPVDWLLVAVLMVAVVTYPRVRSAHPAAAKTGGPEAAALAPTVVEGR